MKPPLYWRGKATATKTDREILIDYLMMKARQEDWHGVSDAANDLREMDARQSSHQPLV